MSLNTELTLYLIALLITVGLAFIVRSVIDLNRRTNARITAVQNRLTAMIFGKDPRSSDVLHGEIDVVHPKTGEKLVAQARFKIDSEK